MIARTALYPRWRSVGLMAAGAPVAVLAAVLGRSDLWSVCGIWIASVLLAMGADALLGPSAGAVQPEVAAPDRLDAGRAGEATVRLRGTPAAAVQLAIEANAIFAVEPGDLVIPSGEAWATFRLVPLRRGHGVLEALHLRWAGPLGLVWKQRFERLDRVIDVTPNISAVREEALHLLSRAREVGTARQGERAASMEFHALREFARGDDSRAVAWRQSARHRVLLARDTQAERNRTIVLAIDTGRLMCEPLDGGLPRVDHAINAALLMAYMGLKSGDRVGLFAFAAHPSLASGTTSGVAAFGALQRLAAGIDYTTEETNFTLGLSRLGATLPGRSLVVIFTEFADTTAAALMIDSIARLTARHLVLFISFEDSELESLVRAEPQTSADVSRAVVAGGLLREREAVFARLRRLGVDLLEAPAPALGPALVRRYLALKREDRL